MHIGILSRGDGWHVRDLIRAAGEMGHSAEPVDFRRLFASVPTSRLDPLDAFDRLLVRTMPAGSLEQIVFRMDILHAAAAAGLPLLNPPRAVETCVDKYLTNVRLAEAGLPVPRTIVCQKADDACVAFNALGRDVVVKPLFGSEGRGMLRISDAELAWRTFHAIEQTGGVIYLQEFVRHPGWDVRAFVLDGRLLGAMKRTGHGDWRTNVAQGGSAEKLELAGPETKLAFAAATATGAIVAGVDLMQNERGDWFVIEVNAVPGWQALAPTCGIDVAHEVVQHLVDLDSVALALGREGLGVRGHPVPLAQTACIWEVSARKPGNVHPTASFTNTHFTDFLVSAAAIAPHFADHCANGIGATILSAVKATMNAVGQNTNLGIVLALAPLVACRGTDDMRVEVARVLTNLTIEDAQHVYQAIRIASPAGLGDAAEQDVKSAPTVTLLEAMTLAADRDLIARQYANGFADVFDLGLPAFVTAFQKFRCIEPAIIECHLHWLAEFPDTLIVRKAGMAIAEQVREKARMVFTLGGLHTSAGRTAGRDLDAYLRADGNRRNPGTTADLVTACLFIALRKNMVTPSAPFRWQVPDWF